LSYGPLRPCAGARESAGPRVVEFGARRIWAWADPPAGGLAL